MSVASQGGGRGVLFQRNGRASGLVLSSDLTTLPRLRRPLPLSRAGGLFFQQVECAVGSKIGCQQAVDGVAADDWAFFDDSQANAVHQLAKVFHGHEMQVGVSCHS